MPDADPSSLMTLESEVHRLLGRCVLRLQAYELLAKHLAGVTQIKLLPQGGGDELGKAASRYDGSTLGSVVNEIVDRVLVAEGDREVLVRDDGDQHVYVDVTVVLPDEVRDALVTGHRDLVRLRNELVHGFLQACDVWSVDGLREAASYLRGAYDVIDARFVELRGWVQMIQGLAEA